MYVCMYVYMYVCMHACMHVCMHVCMHACILSAELRSNNLRTVAPRFVGTVQPSNLVAQMDRGTMAPRACSLLRWALRFVGTA
jgi:hypothetical protein